MDGELVVRGADSCLKLFFHFLKSIVGVGDVSLQYPITFCKETKNLNLLKYYIPES